MQPSLPLPQVAIVVVSSAGGPYRTSDVLSLAFVEPTVGRLVSHIAHEDNSPSGETPLVPDSISVRVLQAAGPYEAGSTLTLWFVDPSVARIAAPPPASVAAGEPSRGSACDAVRDDVSRETESEPEPAASALRDDAVERSSAEIEAVLATRRMPATPPVVGGFTGQATSRGSDTSPSPERGVEIHLEWTSDRVRRFITVVDKLFTVERLGWYRHVLAMRLLVPDRIVCGDAPSDMEAMRHLHALRAASVETLGRPLLAAFMPNFAVTPDWLESIDSPAAARALAGVRAAIAPFVTDGVATTLAPSDQDWTVGRIVRSDYDRAPAASVEALMPVLIASESAHDELTHRLSAYRRTLGDVFGQTAGSAEAVRLGAMTQPNHSLDDRLWQLVGTVGETFGGLSVA